jgi:GINS complex protein
MSEAQALASKDHPAVQISEDQRLGPFEKGHEYRMARWMAEQLKIEGILEIKDPQPVTNTEVSKILWREVRSSVLTKLPERFYPRLRNYLRNIRLQASKTGKPIAIREEEQALQNLRDLLNSRQQKILRLTQATSPPITALEGLTPEERELYQQVREIIDSWTEELQDF